MNIRRKRPAPPPPPSPEVRPGPIDTWLIGLLFLILVCGIMAVLSASGPISLREHGDATYYFRNQTLYLLMGSIALAVICVTPRWLINRSHYAAVLIVLFLLAACLFTSVRINGARRWIQLAGLNLQPMEFARVALVLYLGYFFSSKKTLVTNVTDGLKTNFLNILPPIIITCLMGGLLVLQPDLGGAALLLGIFISMAFVGGIRKTYFLVIIIAAGLALVLLIWVEPYRLARWTAFLDPFADSAKDTGWQLRQSLYALGRGGFFGTGIGGSLQKLSFLSQSHNDFILSVIGEEVGFIGVMVLMFLFAAFIWRCFLVALHQHDLHDRLNAFGFTVALSISILFNIAVVFGAVPPKGVALPFISYGGSSLLANMICAGFLLHYSRTSRE